MFTLYRIAAWCHFATLTRLAARRLAVHRLRAST
jgi:hypothetical protein